MIPYESVRTISPLDLHMNRIKIYSGCIEHIQKLRYYWLRVNGFNENHPLSFQTFVFTHPHTFKMQKLDKTIDQLGGFSQYYKYHMLKKMLIAAEDKDDFFHNCVPTEYLLDIAMEYKIADWCQYAIDTDPDLAHLDSSSQREDENWHDLNEIMGT